MGKKQKILLSGVKPTGAPHIGNYFGAMKQFVNLQDTYDESLFFIADYHALNTVQNRDEMKKNIFEIALDYLAIGLDTKKVIFKKSKKEEKINGIGWLFECSKKQQKI